MAIKTAADINSDNPLHQYRTYSYHHVLIACASNKIAEADFANLPFDQLTPTTQAIGNVAARCTPQFINGDPEKPFIVMINTLVDVEFLIKSFTFKMQPVPPPMPVEGLKDYQYARSAFVTDGTLVIEEPFGIRFGDMIAQISKNLNAPPERIVFVLRTAFFGFSDQGVTVIQQIKPLPLFFMSVEATFTAAGGHYEIQFVPYVNGFANRREITNIGAIAKFQSQPTLGAAMSKLESIINAETKKSTGVALQPITYKILLDNRYTNYGIESAQPGSKNVTEIQFCASANDSLTEIIEKIMMMSAQVKAELNVPSQTSPTTETNPRTKRVQFKIFSEVTNTRNEFTVTYRIYPYSPVVMPVPTEADKTTNPTILKQKRENAINEFIQNAKDDNNYLEYNYIYTGKNIDVLDFQMKLNLFSMYQSYYIESMNWAAMVSVKGKNESGTNVTGQKDGINQSSRNLSDKLSTIPEQSHPINLAMRDVKEFQAFDDYLSRTASIFSGNTYVNLTIAGDPRLYAGYLQSPFESDKLQDTGKLSGNPNLVMSNWAQVPALVKINVVMPNPPTAVVQDQTPQQAFGSAFWFDGLYLIVSIANMFSEDGKFIQQLELLPIPNDYNIPDITDIVKSEGTNTVDQTLTSQEPGVKPKATKTDLLTDQQKKCLAHAYRIAQANGMPPETLQAIMLVDSNACALRSKSVVSNSDIVYGSTTLSVSRVQTYLNKDPSALITAAKVSGVKYEPSNTDSIRFLLTLNDDFNLTMCSKIWLEDREVVKKIFAKPVVVGRGASATVSVSANKSNVTDQATIAHNNIFTKQSKTALEDVGFNNFGDAPVTADNYYIKSINAQKDLIVEFNGQVLPTITG